MSSGFEINTEKSRSLIHNLFLVSAATGLILNIAFDFKAFEKNNESDLMGSRLANSVQVVINLEKLSHLLDSDDFAFQNASIENELKKITEFRPEALDAASIIELKKAIATSPKRAADVTRSILEAKVVEIEKLQQTDRMLDAQVEGGMRKALIWDIGLIGTMLVLFILNARAKQKAEQNLKSSLVNMRESLIGLEEKAFSRKIASKMVVHDLKNPIGTIMGFAQLLHDDPKSELTVTEFSERIRQISERSLVLVESLLSENEAGAESKEKIDIVPIIQEIASQLEIQAARKEQKIIREIKIQNAFLLGDSLKMEEVISNVLGNAIKYSPPGAKIKIKANTFKDSIQIEIEDQGPGFSAYDKKNAFQFGKKLSAVPTANESSTGYGLYIVKQITEACGGEVVILDSASGKGAVVQIRLPLLKERGSPLNLTKI